MKDYALALYTQPSYIPCQATKRALKRQGLEFVEIDVHEDPDTSRAVLDQYGLNRTPAVIGKVDGKTYQWQGHSEESIEAFVELVKEDAA
ncbi:glutaredoxin-like protein NrdH [Micrococcales bacterium KH10]|nr:glutaredoxin-like protein NrdH [Micrococcales bacterium KH10]